MQNSTRYFTVLKLAMDNRICFYITRDLMYYRSALQYLKLCKCIRQQTIFSSGFL